MSYDPPTTDQQDDQQDDELPVQQTDNSQMPVDEQEYTVYETETDEEMRSTST
jgi:hypothetical protein